LGAFFFGYAEKKPGFPLQFLVSALRRFLRDFRCNPWRVGGRPLACK
jgi:hypothetical protein